jgi:hypothetical protein
MSVRQFGDLPAVGNGGQPAGRPGHQVKSRVIILA